MRTIENLRQTKPLTPALSKGEADRAKGREVMEKKAAEAAATDGHPKK
jgi:hypothetical protein